MWFVFGVQSSASRTVPSGATDADRAAVAEGTAVADGFGAAVAAVCAGLAGDEPAGAAQPPIATSTTNDSATLRLMSRVGSRLDM